MATQRAIAGIAAMALLCAPAVAQKSPPSDDTKLCLEAGRVLRANADSEYRQAVIGRVKNNGWIDSQDYGSITSRKPRVGMSLCGVLAALGRPNDTNKTVTAAGEHWQLIYRSPRRMYVYLDNDRVTGWQE